MCKCSNQCPHQLKYIRKVENTNTAQKIKFSIKDFFGKCDQIRRTTDLVTFTEEILNRKLYFFWAVE